MKISSVSQFSNIYAQNAVSMKARKSKNRTIQDFKDFLRDNRLILKAQITPTRNGKFFTELELAKKQGYTTVHLTDEDGYGIMSSGYTLNSAILDMAEKYRRNKVYLNEGGLQTYTIP